MSGARKGMRLEVPRGKSTRPPLDRLRASLFNTVYSIGGDGFWAGAAVLDLFSGTGSFGLEALSRGAARVLFVESGPGRALQANIERLRYRRKSSVLRRNLAKGLPGRARKDSPYRMVFCDPPFPFFSDAGECQGVEELLVEVVEVLQPEGLLMVRLPVRRAHDPQLPVLLEVVHRRTHGKSEVLLLAPARTADQPPGPLG